MAKALPMSGSRYEYRSVFLDQGYLETMNELGAQGFYVSQTIPGYQVELGVHSHKVHYVPVIIMERPYFVSREEETSEPDTLQRGVE